MKTVTTIGIDLAKSSFSVYGVDAKSKPVLSRSGFTSLDQSTAKLRWTVLLVMPPI